MTKLWCKIMFKNGVDKLKEMKGSSSIYTPLETQLKEASKEAFMCASSKKRFLRTSLTKSQL